MPLLHSPRVDWVMEGKILSLLAQRDIKCWEIIKEKKKQSGQIISKDRITKAKKRQEQEKTNCSPTKRKKRKRRKN